MLKYKHILVPYDGSPHAAEALKLAAKFTADGDDATLTLVSVSKGEDDTDILLSVTEAQVPAGVEYHAVEIHGQPGSAIVQYAQDEDIDLIIMGSRGMSAFKGMFMGSVSSYVVSHSTCPVIIVK